MTALVEKNPQSIKARIQLGRVYFWQGDINSALGEAERAIRQAPGDRDALLLKADIARIKRDFPTAISIYQEILKTGEDFDARNGLATTYIASGDLTQARQNLNLLVPAFPYQRSEVERLNKLITEAEQPRTLTRDEQARQAQERGNKLTEEGNHQAAAEEYLIAFSLSKTFTAEEQLRMATVLSWAGSLDETQRRLTAILAENPALIQARIQLARVLLWSGELDAALREIHKVQATEPNNRDARLVQASGTRMKRNYRPAVNLYKDLIREQGDYDAYEGLTYAYLLSNDRISTDKTIPLLKPAHPYEEKSLRELKQSRDIKFNPSIVPGFTYYSDNDDNEVWTYFSTATVWFGNWQTTLDYTRVDAKDPDIKTSLDNIVLSTYSRMPFYGGIGGSVGLTDWGRFVPWSVRGDIDIPDGSIGVRVGDDALAYTAAVIDNHIHAFNSPMYALYRPTDRVTLFGNYSYRDYSDDNSANDLIGSISYLVLRKLAAIAIGYRGRYLDFRRQSGGGYFDPFNFVSNVAFVNISYEKNDFYGYLEPYFGYQTYTRYEEGNNSSIMGAAGMLGYRFSKHFAMEVNLEGGDYAVSASGASNYYQVGSKFIINF